MRGRFAKLRPIGNRPSERRSDYFLVGRAHTLPPVPCDNPSRRIFAESQTASGQMCFKIRYLASEGFLALVK